MLEQSEHLISDYTFEKDALFAAINLAGDELDMYYRIQEALAEKIPQPDLMVYLRASTPTLMERIARRDRTYERTMEWDYIDQLNQAYDRFFLNQPHAMPVLVIDANVLDYVRYVEDLQWVENRIRQALQLSPFQPELPMPRNHDQ